MLIEADLGPHSAARITERFASEKFGKDVDISASFAGSGTLKNQILGGAPVQVTNLPLDVDNFRVSPTGDRIALSMAVFRDCADLACTKQRMDAQAKNKATGRFEAGA